MQKSLSALIAFLLAACGQAGDDMSSLDLNEPIPALLPWKSDTSSVQKTGSGLEYVVLVAGDASGTPPSTSDMVTVHYDGRLASDGTQFDSSRQRGTPASFPAGALISGWVEALQLMRPGDRWVLYIPYRLAYGEQGRPPVIPAAADLVFDVELIAVNDDSG